MSDLDLPAVRLSLLYAALFFDFGITLPFLPIWLQSNGLDAAEIATVLATPLLGRLLANPIVADFADRRGAVARTLAVSAVGVLVGTAALAMSRHYVTILGIVFLIGLAQGPLIALADTYTWAKLRRQVVPARRERVYGQLRLWGSLGFIVASIGAGQVLDWFRPSSIIWLLVGAAAVLAVTAASVARSEPAGAAQAPKRPSPPGHLWRLALIIVGAALVQASHALYYGFSSIHWAKEGHSGTEIGVLWSVAVTTEVLFFALGARIFWALGGPPVVLLLGASGAVLRWGAMALDPSLSVLLLLQMLHAVSFGATHLASMAAISRLAPVHLQARAQGWLAALWAGVMALLMALSGQFYEPMGEGAYLLMAAVATVGLTLFTLASYVRTTGLTWRTAESDGNCPLGGLG